MLALPGVSFPIWVDPPPLPFLLDVYDFPTPFCFWRSKNRPHPRTCFYPGRLWFLSKDRVRAFPPFTNNQWHQFLSIIPTSDPFCLTRDHPAFLRSSVFLLSNPRSHAPPFSIPPFQHPPLSLLFSTLPFFALFVTFFRIFLKWEPPRPALSRSFSPSFTWSTPFPHASLRSGLFFLRCDRQQKVRILGLRGFVSSFIKRLFQFFFRFCKGCMKDLGPLGIVFLFSPSQPLCDGPCDRPFPSAKGFLRF